MRRLFLVAITGTNNLEYDNHGKAVTIIGRPLRRKYPKTMTKTAPLTNKFLDNARSGMT
jgi:hypothetical protein